MSKQITTKITINTTFKYENEEPTFKYVAWATSWSLEIWNNSLHSFKNSSIELTEPSCTW